MGSDPSARWAPGVALRQWTCRYRYRVRIYRTERKGLIAIP
ncbi:hypothetical protein TPY_0445 [Sulfobacillus acidophilus TPY]|nr:hypothetical protein TPY_0445 [Sulfobacillus acidophilus TPY]